MTNHIHLLGGSGKIGRKLCESLQNKKIKGFDNVWVYCDGFKASNNSDFISQDENKSSIFYKNYASFSIDRLANENFLSKNSKNIILNLRGVNNKRDWLNKPLEALDVQLQSCLNIVNSDINLYPNTKLIHLSSQLCELIEGKNSLQEICEGEDSYRQAYMVSRLHQEAIIKAYAYKYGVETKFIRLPAIYGFNEDIDSPWILSNLIKQLISKGKINIRKPNTYTWLTHTNVLTNFLRHTISRFSNDFFESNVSYLVCPRIGLKLKTLSKLVENLIIDESYLEKFGIDDEVKISGLNNKKDLILHINYLKTSIMDLYKGAKRETF